MYYLYGKINRGHAICPLYGGCPLFGESAIRGFTVRTFSSIVCNLFHVMLQYFCHWLNGVHFNRIFMAKLQYYPFQYLKCYN